MSVVDVWPVGSMALLTKNEADAISLSGKGELYELYRNCSLAVLNSGNITDNSADLLENSKDFEINIIRNERGLKLELVNPPESAIVDGIVIKKLRNHLYSVLRDIIQLTNLSSVLNASVKSQFDDESDYITHLIFIILRNAQVLKAGAKPNIAVCWGGHSICKEEYDYAYKVGFEMGLRYIDICTGCGPGVMEAPMKGSLQGYSQQCAQEKCRLIGLTEPSIIAAEPPNTMVDDLIILPDIEKRLEAFVRLGHTLIIFPGGPGTAEELLYILSIKLHPENKHNFIPLILTGNKQSEEYFKALEDFLITCFGKEITRYYDLIIDDPVAVANKVKKNNESVFDHRTITHDSYCFNWTMKIPYELQIANTVTHEFMSSLNLTKEQEEWKLAANLRSAFSGIVAGNVKDYGIQAVKKNGPFVLHGDKMIIDELGKLLENFIKQHRILLSQKEYKPCYTFE
ncbi:MAG: nucleotide 5'-monophosphate nucleosidase PpnN [Succinatimonas hippei]|nr:nucleotide 5'-monophosphate nucleosidase PpnN [Succinatimonas hippei]